MTINQFIQANGLKQADAIVLRKKFLGMVDHYAIFVGYRNSNPVFIANYRDGVQEVSNQEMKTLLQILEPIAIEKFQGNEIERIYAVRRAMSRVGEEAYSYITNNCEHFKNWVHSGENRSDQVNTAGNIALTVGAGTALAALASKSPKTTAIGLGLVLAGLILKNFAEE